MKEIKFRKVNGIRIDEEHDIGVFEINGAEFIILGGDFTARGIVNFLRPYDKAKDKLHNRKYARSKRDVVYYMDSENTMKCLETVRDLRRDMRCQKW